MHRRSSFSTSTRREGGNRHDHDPERGTDPLMERAQGGWQMHLDHRGSDEYLEHDDPELRP